MVDLDLESLEAILEKEKQEKNAERKEKEEERRKEREASRKHENKAYIYIYIYIYIYSSRSRSGSHHHKSHHHRESKDRSREREHGRGHKHRHRSRSNSGKEQRKDYRMMMDAKSFDPYEKQQEALTRQLEEASKYIYIYIYIFVIERQVEEAHRDDCTVLVQRISLEADERELYMYFVKAEVGKVRDVRIIRDQRSNKSKGVGYVEFYSPESVLMAMTLSGQKFKGHEIIVQASQAEKNRAAQAAKFKKDLANKQTQKPKDPNLLPMRIYVEGLPEALGEVTEKEVKQVSS